ELGNAICARIDRECEWVIQAWDGIIPGLMARKYDAIMSSMTINDERREKVLFSDTSITPPSAWFAPAKSTLSEASQETLEGKAIGVQRGTLQDNYVSDLYSKSSDVKRYTTADDLVLDMDAGRLDIAFLDFPVGKSTLIDGGNGNYKAVGEVVTEPKKYFGDGFGIAMRKRDKDLAEQINGALADLKSDGTYDTIHTKYFGEKK
ncbi:MAG: transporter substrate-binding domain-containing protein, partial [Cobetia crustatorum]